MDTSTVYHPLESQKTAWYQPVVDTYEECYQATTNTISNVSTWYNRQVRNITNLLPEPLREIARVTLDSLPITLACSFFPTLNAATIVTLLVLQIFGVHILSNEQIMNLKNGVGIFCLSAAAFQGIAACTGGSSLLAVTATIDLLIAGILFAQTGLISHIVDSFSSSDTSQP